MRKTGNPGTVRDIEARARAFHRGEHLPVVTHLVADAPLPHALRGVM
jgi:hypothetical protein